MGNWNVSVKKKRFHLNQEYAFPSQFKHKREVKTFIWKTCEHYSSSRDTFSVLKSHLSIIKLKSEILSSYTLNTKEPVCNSVCNESKNIHYSWFCSHVHNVPTHPILTYQPGAKRKAKLLSPQRFRGYLW